MGSIKNGQCLFKISFSIFNTSIFTSLVNAFANIFRYFYSILKMNFASMPSIIKTINFCLFDENNYINENDNRSTRDTMVIWHTVHNYCKVLRNHERKTIFFFFRNGNDILFYTFNLLLIRPSKLKLLKLRF